MKTFIKTFFFFTVLLFVSYAWGISVYVVDELSTGNVYRWKDGYVKMYYDKSGLNPLVDNSAARQMVQGAMSKWNDAELIVSGGVEDGEKVKTTGVHFDTSFFEFVDKVTTENLNDYWVITDNKAYNPSRPTVFIFDDTGELSEKAYWKTVGENDALPLGLTQIFALDSDPDKMEIINGTIIINGLAFYDSNNNYVDDGQLRATILHELGHLINLDHSALNAKDFTKENQYVPTMYHSIDSTSGDAPNQQYSLHDDDIISASQLYNGNNENSDFRKKFCRITGFIRDKEGRQFQGAHVIAYQVDDQKIKAVSAVTGNNFPICPSPLNDAGLEVPFGRYILPGIVVGKEYKITYGPIPNWCEGSPVDECSLGSGINPYLPPRPLDSGSIKTKDNKETFKCEVPGQQLEAQEVHLEEDLSAEVYKDYVAQLGKYCEPGVGNIFVPPDDEPKSNAKLFKKGWCSLVSGAASNLDFLLWLIPLAPFVVIRRKYR